MRRALITGALGQDGSYLAEHLLKLRYEVWGMVRYPNMLTTPNRVEGVNYIYGDMRDEVSIANILKKSSPTEIYNLAGQVFVPNSWLLPAETIDVNTNGLVRILNCIDKLGMQEDVRVYQASTSEMFGNAITNGKDILTLDETSPMNPVSPYGVSKYAAHKLVDVYRQKGFYVVSGILFNHESPRRGTEMVTRKITTHIAQWVHNEHAILRLGTLRSRRDWGFAGDFVKAMHLMLQQPLPDDYVIGTGESHSIEDFLQAAIEVSNLGMTYKDLLLSQWIMFDCPQFGRTPELHALTADYSKARSVLGWKPSCKFEELVRLMVDHDVKLLEKNSSKEPSAYV